MKVFIAMITILGSVAAARAQVAPEATSPRDLGISGTLTYSAYASLMVESYGNVSGQMLNLSGNFGYASTSHHHPTSVNFSAGDGWAIAGTTYNEGLYENLSLSQGIAGKRASLQLSDMIGYFRGTPIMGFSGVPGSGEPISQPNPIPSPQAVVALNTSMVTNSSTAQYSYTFSPLWTLSAGSSYEQLYYPSGFGLNMNSLTFDGELNRRLNARNSVFGQYAYSQFSYPGASATIDTQNTVFGWQRTWTRHVTSSVSAGPQWISFHVGVPAPASIGLTASASVTDTSKLGSINLAYSHGVDGGEGYFYGAEMDSATGSFNRQFGRRVQSQFSLEFSGGYMRTSALSGLSSASLPGGFATQGNFDEWLGSVQGTRNLGRNFSVYASYTGTDQIQSSSPQGAANLLNGLWQVVSFGIGFTPQPVHLRH